jgi:hypothetical protein
MPAIAVVAFNIPIPVPAPTGDRCAVRAVLLTLSNDQGSTMQVTPNRARILWLLTGALPRLKIVRKASRRIPRATRSTHTGPYLSDQ